MQARLSYRLPVWARSFRSSAPSKSHVGSAPIPFPSSVTLVPSPGLLTVTGPKGTKAISIPPFLRVTQAPSSAPATSASPSEELTVAVEDSSVKIQRATWGLKRALIANAVKGVSDGFAIPLKLVGVGFRAVVEADPAAEPGSNAQRLNMKLNLAHNVFIPIPQGITATTPLPTRIVLRGTDKQELGQFAAQIRSWRKPEPYKGKGIFVGSETIKLKDVKKK